MAVILCGITNILVKESDGEFSHEQVLEPVSAWDTRAEAVSYAEAVITDIDDDHEPNYFSVISDFKPNHIDYDLMDIPE